MKIEIVRTKDGSNTLFVKDLNETYHSIHGALTESIHVFIENGLSSWLSKSKKDHLAILEVGFGTGLNAILSMQHCAGRNISVHYHAIEPNPIDESIFMDLQFGQNLNPPQADEWLLRLHQLDFNITSKIVDGFYFEKTKTPFENFQSARTYDIIYFDAFAPSKQPEMWDYRNLAQAFQLTNPNGLFVTYSAKGEVKRNLRKAGYHVVSRPGPPGKREMTQGWKGPPSP